MKTFNENELFDILMNDTNLLGDSTSQDSGILMLNEFMQQISKIDIIIANTFTLIEGFIADINLKVEDQLNEVLHHPDFLKFEATWRGINYLIQRSLTDDMLKIKILNVTKDELFDDATNAIEFDQTALFKKIYEHEYGTLGGEPFICLVGDYEFGKSNEDVELLTSISGTAAAAHSMFISAASPSLFGMRDYSSLSYPRDLKKIFQSSEFLKWNALREKEDSRYVTLLLPHVLMREPYSMKKNPPKGINFNEHVTGYDNSKFCWGNPAYVMAERITNAVSLYNWPCAIRGAEGGGLIEDLPAYTFETTLGDVALKCPTETNITDRREKELTDLGLIGICHSKGSDKAVIFGSQTIQKPVRYNTDEANANANLSARLTYLLAASRFAHYVKAIVRDKVGSFETSRNLQDYLTRWISKYILLNANSASQEVKASIPLSAAKIIVTDDESNPGVYNAVIFLKPHFQLEELTASIRLVAKIPAQS